MLIKLMKNKIHIEYRPVICRLCLGPNPVLWAKLRKFFTLLKDYKKGKRKRICSRDLILPENPIIYNIWHFREKFANT